MHEIGDPVVKVAILGIVLLNLLGPHSLLKILQLLEQLVEDVLSHFLSDEEDQALGEDRNVVVDEGVADVLEPLGPAVGHLDCEVLEVQQLLPLHIASGVDFVLLKVVFELVDALGEDVDLVRLGPILEPDAPEQGGAVLDERDGDAQFDEADFLEVGGLLELVGLLAEGNALGVEFKQVGHDQSMLDVDLERAFGFKLHHGFVGAHRDAAELVHFEHSPALVALAGLADQEVRLRRHPLHGTVLQLQVEAQFVEQAEFAQVDARLDQSLAFEQEQI